jgi:hypothetical protein
LNVYHFGTVEATGLKIFGASVTSNGMTFILNFIKIYRFRILKGEGRHPGRLLFSSLARKVG